MIELIIIFGSLRPLHAGSMSVWAMTHVILHLYNNCDDILAWINK